VGADSSMSKAPLAAVTLRDRVKATLPPGSEIRRAIGRG